MVLSDNERIAHAVRHLIIDKGMQASVAQAHSPKAPASLYAVPWSQMLDLNRRASELPSTYELVVSAHSKQIFPASLVQAVECINIHPGYNPETRGWFPQIWAILLGHKLGLTIHKMDSQLDHGPIIDRIEVPVFLWDTSKSAYDRVINQEILWLTKNFESLLAGQYETFLPEYEGNLFLRKDFSNLCEFDLNEKATFREFYNRLRALSFDGYANGYIRDPSTGDKIFIELQVKPESTSKLPDPSGRE